MAKKNLVFIVIRQYKDQRPQIISAHQTAEGAVAKLEEEVTYGNNINEHYNACWNSRSTITIYEDGAPWEVYHIEQQELVA